MIPIHGRIAREYYYLALTKESKEDRDRNFALTFRALGQVIHLIEDMAVPAHVRNDNHADIPVFAPYGKDMYEHYWTTGRTFPSPTYSVVELSQFSNYWDTNVNTSGFGSGLSEFTNHNFLSRDTNFDAGDTSLHGYNYPENTETWHTEYERVIVRKMQIPVPITVEVDYMIAPVVDNYSGGVLTNEYLTVHSFWDYELNKWCGVRAYSLNDHCHTAYGEFLLPRAVGYSAGLIDYFFRGKMGVPTKEAVSTATDVYDLTLEIKNESSYTMTGGTFTLMVKTGDTSYANLGEENVSSIASGGTFDWNLYGKYIPMPAYAEDDFSNIEFTLIYDGQIGQEEGVVGKVFTGICGDNTPPEITDVTIKNESGIEILPDDNDVYMVWDTVTIEVDVSDTGSVCFSGIDKVVFFIEDDLGDTYYLNGTVDVPTQDDHDEPIGGTYTIDWNTDIFDPGEYTLHILAYDQAGNVGTAEVKFCYRKIIGEINGWATNSQTKGTTISPWIFGFEASYLDAWQRYVAASYGVPGPWPTVNWGWTLDGGGGFYRTRIVTSRRTLTYNLGSIITEAQFNEIGKVYIDVVRTQEMAGQIDGGFLTTIPGEILTLQIKPLTKVEVPASALTYPITTLILQGKEAEFGDWKTPIPTGGELITMGYRVPSSQTWKMTLYQKPDYPHVAAPICSYGSPYYLRVSTKDATKPVVSPFILIK